MSDDWELLKWGDLATLEYGKALRTYTATCNIARVFGTNGTIGWHDQSLWRAPGVIVGRKGAYRGVHYTEDDFWVIDTAYALRPKTSINLRWAYYQLKTVDLDGLDEGSSIPSTTRPAFYALPVLKPPLSEQEKIARTLGALDDKIDLNNRLAATLEAIMQTLFKSWFVDFDPVRSKVEGRQTALPQHLTDLFPDCFSEDSLPDGWKTRSVLDQADWVNGAAYKDMHFSDAPEALPVIKIAELKSGISASTKHTKTSLGDRYRIATGELLFSWSGSPETSIDTFIWVEGDAWLNQHIFAARPNGNVSRAYLFAMLKFLKSDLIEIARNKQTTGLGHVTRQDLARLQVPCGGAAILSAFETMLSPLYARLQTTLEESRTLSKLRDTLLPKLISGALRIRNAEHFVGEAA